MTFTHPSVKKRHLCFLLEEWIKQCFHMRGFYSGPSSKSGNRRVDL